MLVKIAYNHLKTEFFYSTSVLLQKFFNFGILSILKIFVKFNNLMVRQILLVRFVSLFEHSYKLDCTIANSLHISILEVS